MKRLTENKHWRLIEKYNIDKLLYLLIDRPDEINFLNDFIWRNSNNQVHRNYDLPAEIWYNGLIQYWKYDKIII